MPYLYANIEQLIISILLVVLLFLFNLRYWKPDVINPLSCIYLLVIVGCALEIADLCIDGRPELRWLNYLLSILSLGSVGLVGANGIAFGSSQFPKPVWKNRREFLIWMIPLGIELAALISSPFTGAIFRVTEAGHYERTSSFVLQLIPYGYLLANTFYAVYWYRKEQTTKQRYRYLSIALLAVPPVCLGSIQLFFEGNAVSTVEFSIVLSLLINFAITQNNLITQDSLTHLSNRGELDIMLYEAMRNKRRGEKGSLYVLMGDLDGFKAINDSCGHPEGDRALILAAKTISETVAGYKSHVARYGGDEFMIILESVPDDLPEKLIDELNEKLLEASRDEKFHLSISIGYARFRPSDTVSDLIKAADRELYMVKDRRKQKTN